MKRLCSIIIVLSIILCMSACGNADTDNTTSSREVTKTTIETTKSSTETTDSKIKTYPLNVDSAYADFAVSIPKVIFSTTASENGLAGSIYSFEGTIEEINTYKDETGTFTYADAKVATENGPVTVTNLFKTIYDATVTEYGETTTKTIYADDVNDYIFPEKGETANFIAIYMGYSQRDNMPVFALGASCDLYEMADLNDPIVNEEQSIDPTESTTSGNNQNKNQNQNQNTNSIAPSSESGETTASENTQSTDTNNNTPSSDPGITTGKKNALNTAKNYLSIMPFSYHGLIDQLEYEEYTIEEATYAADNCGADWNEQALKAAKNYLDVMPFSYSGLISQLEFDQYTTSQATYGADHCGADWYEQAAKAAANYLDVMSFSRDGLISQLEFDGFTHDQAVYGVDQNDM